jgi:hypothetical protein
MRKLLITSVLVFSLILLPSVTHAQTIKDRVMGLFRYFQGSGLAAVKKAPSTTSGTLAPLSGDGIVYSSDALYTWSGTSPETLAITQGTVTFTTNTFSFHPNLIVSASGGSVLFQVPNSLTGLTLNGGSATIATGTNNVLTTKSLSISGYSYLDITNGGVIVDYSGTVAANSPISTIKGYILSARPQAGFANATWAGNGIRSSSAAMDPNAFAVGYAENASLVYDGPYTTFMGQPADMTSVLVRFTQAADFTLDGKAGDNDVAIIGGYYDQDRSLNHHWHEGDASYDGKIGDDDVTYIGATYNEFLQVNELVATPSSSSVTLNWNKFTTGNTTIVKKIGNGSPSNLTTTANSSYTDSAVTPGTIYTYQVKGPNGQLSNLVQVKVPAVSQIPAAPSNLVATAVSSTQINLSWFDNSSNETGFILDRATDAAFTQNVVSTTVAQNAVSSQATGLNPSTAYYFRVKAASSVGNSANSNTANATTQGNSCGNLCVPVLNSKPGAPVTLYLDFDGDPGGYLFGVWTVTPTPAYDSVSPSDPGYDPTTFSATDLAYINEIWKRVSEKYSPFNVNITTVDPGTYPDRVAFKMVVGGNGIWNGGAWAGIARQGGFYDPNVPNNSTAFAFSEVVNGVPKWVAETIAHYSGQALGLYYQSVYNAQGTLVNTFNTGNNLGNAPTAPIMGDSTSGTRGLWWFGDSGHRTGFTTFDEQDDIIALTGTNIDGVSNVLSFRTDDYGNTIQTASPLTGSGTRTASGIIERPTDTDYFSFTTAGGSVTLSVTGASVGQMLDPILTVYNASGVQVANADTSALNETLTTTLSAGTYYVSVKGHGYVSVFDTTYNVDGGKLIDLGQYTVTVTGP